MELLDIFDEKMSLIGQAERERAHKEGLIHQVVHVWITAEIRGGTAIAFQQRSFDKKDFPGLYDIAVGGHVDAGEDRTAAALREMREEIGLDLKSDDLMYLGCVRDDLTVGDFVNREFAHVYLFKTEQACFLPGPEVARMIWVPVSMYQRIMDGTDTVTAWTQTGEDITVAKHEWCVHPGREDLQMILPILKTGKGNKDDGLSGNESQ